MIFKNKKKLRLDGFTSTSLSKDIAYRYMFGKSTKNEISVLYEIKNLDKDGFKYFSLDNE